MNSEKRLSERAMNRLSVLAAFLCMALVQLESEQSQRISAVDKKNNIR